MLALFKSNQVTAIFWVILYAVFIHLPAMVGWKAPLVVEAVQGGYLYYLLPDWLKVPGVYSTVAVLVLVIFQSVLIYDLSGRYRILEPRNWLPSMAYILVASSLPEFSQMSAPLLAITLFPLILGKLFGIYKKASVIGSFFDVGFLLGVGILIYPPVIVFLVPILLGFRTLRSFSLHERLLLLLGILAPVYLVWTWAFWVDRTPEFWQYTLGPLHLHWGVRLPEGGVEWLKTGLWIVFVLVTLLSITSYYYKKLIQNQKFISILFWFLIAGIVLQFVFDASSLQPLLVLATSLGILIGHTFSTIRKPMLAEALHLLLLAVVIIIQLFPILN